MKFKSDDLIIDLLPITDILHMEEGQMLESVASHGKG